MQDELQRKAEDYDKTKSTMNATKQAETEKSLQDMYTKIQQAAQDNQQAFNKMQQEKLGPILDKVRKAIEEVAKAGNYVYIMEQSAGQPLYVNTAISEDITAKVKAKLK
jgi:outer membrane protein